MNVLLTGSSGFIGKAVYKELLHSDIDLHIISRREQPLIKNSFVLDLLDHKETNWHLKKINPDILIHLAWDVSHDTFWDSIKNTDYADASINLFSSFIKNGGKKIIAMGTCAEYPTADYPMPEDMNVNLEALTHYGREKRRVSEWLKNHARDFTWLRIFGVYGEGENPNRLFPSLINAIQTGKHFVLKNPFSFFDYLNVRDIARIVRASLEKEGQDIVNTGSGQSYSVLDIYQSIQCYLESGNFFINKTITTPDHNSRIPDCHKLKSMGHHFSFNFSLS